VFAIDVPAAVRSFCIAGSINEKSGFLISYLGTHDPSLAQNRRLHLDSAKSADLNAASSAATLTPRVWSPNVLA